MCDAVAVGLCGGCRAALEAAPVPDLRPELDSVSSVFSYSGVGVELLRALKFSNRRRSLALLVGAALPALSGEPVELVVPVPPEPARRRRRGYDLPDLVARAVARRLGVARAQPLRRVDHGSQRTRDRVERTLLGGYEARRRVAGRVLLVDDVVTTGSTARACASELRRVGAGSVALFVLASTPPPSSRLSSRGPPRLRSLGIADSEVSSRCR